MLFILQTTMLLWLNTFLILSFHNAKQLHSAQSRKQQKVLCKAQDSNKNSRLQEFLS